MGSGDPSVTSAPYTATASGGGQVTIPQGSTIANIAPTLTNFQQQPDQMWNNLLKGLVGQVVGKPGGAPAATPATPTIPAMGGGGGGGGTIPAAPGRGVALGGQAPQIPTMLGTIDPVALKATAMMLKQRLMGF